MNTLTEIGLKHQTDKANHHCFTKVYEHYFSSLRDKHLNILEIGIDKGCSLRTFKEYFFNSQIYAIDILDKSYLAKEGYNIAQGDQTDINFLTNVFQDVIFDIIIDDGGHLMNQQQISLEFLMPRLKTNGIYILEDLHTSYDFGYKTNNDNTTLHLLENIKNINIIDHNFFIKDLESLQKQIASCQILYTKNIGSVSSIIIKK